MVLSGVFQGISYFLTIIRYVLLAYCLLSWVLPPYNKLMMMLSRFIDPLLRPIRNVMFRIFPRMPIDLSALVAFFVLDLLSRGLWSLYFMLI